MKVRKNAKETGKFICLFLFANILLKWKNKQRIMQISLPHFQEIFGICSNLMNRDQNENGNEIYRTFNFVIKIKNHF